MLIMHIHTKLCFTFTHESVSVCSQCLYLLHTPTNSIHTQHTPTNTAHVKLYDLFVHIYPTCPKHSTCKTKWHICSHYYILYFIEWVCTSLRSTQNQNNQGNNDPFLFQVYGKCLLIDTRTWWSQSQYFQFQSWMCLCYMSGVMYSFIL